MSKVGRNSACPCGSTKKYKKCCLYRGVTMTSKKEKDSNSAKVILVKTLTDELFQPVRLYYLIHNEKQLKEHLRKLKCIDYDVNLDDWTLRYEQEAADIKLKLPPKKIPAKAQPLIIATFYIEQQTMLIDVRSIERGARIIEFIDKYVPRTIAEITHAAILNRLITISNKQNENLVDVDYDDIFNEENITLIEPKETLLEMEKIANQYEDKREAMAIVFQHSQEKSKDQLPEVEKFPVYYYEEGIKDFEIACQYRQVIATQHFLGKKDFSFYDLIQQVVKENYNKLVEAN